jgi:hypothetical protein
MLFVEAFLVLGFIVALAVIMVIVDIVTTPMDEVMREIKANWKSYTPEERKKINEILDGNAERKRKKK